MKASRKLKALIRILLLLTLDPLAEPLVSASSACFPIRLAKKLTQKLYQIYVSKTTTKEKKSKYHNFFE